MNPNIDATPHEPEPKRPAFEVPGPHDVLFMVWSRACRHGGNLLFRYCRPYRSYQSLKRLRRWGDGPEPQPFPSRIRSNETDSVLAALPVEDGADRHL